MRIFLTGATGFIGSKIIPELIQAGHAVLGLTRSDAGAKQLTAAGAEVHPYPGLQPIGQAPGEFGELGGDAASGAHLARCAGAIAFRIPHRHDLFDRAHR